MSKKRNYVYLAGNINEDIRTYEWRDKFTELVKDEDRIVVVNPCKNQFNQSLINSATNGLDFTRNAVKKSQRILRAKDFQLVKMCNIVVVNLYLVSKQKPMVGTIMELAWSRDIFYTPVIGITNGEENIYTMHPWIDECCSAKVETIEEAAETVKFFFLDY